MTGRVFRCPLCGSQYFATDYFPPYHPNVPLADSNHRGRCKGHYLGSGEYTGCTFRWMRRHDAAVFVSEDEPSAPIPNVAVIDLMPRLRSKRV